MGGMLGSRRAGDQHVGGRGVRHRGRASSVEFVKKENVGLALPCWDGRTGLQMGQATGSGYPHRHGQSVVRFNPRDFGLMVLAGQICMAQQALFVSGLGFSFMVEGRFPEYNS